MPGDEADEFNPQGAQQQQLFHLSAFLTHLFWFNSCCFILLIYNSHDDWVCLYSSWLPHSEMTWLKWSWPIKALTEPVVSSNWESGHWFRWRAALRLGLNRWMWERDSRERNQAEEKCTELQLHFTEEHFLQLGRVEPAPRPMVSQQAFIVRCFLCLLFSHFWTTGDSIMRPEYGANEHGYRHPRACDHACLCVHSCASFVCIRPYAHESEPRS